MSLTSRISTRIAAVSAGAAGVALAVTGMIRVTDTPSGETTVVGIEHAQLAALSFALVALVPLVLYIGRVAGRHRSAAVAVTGQVVLATLCVISNVRGEDPSFFPPVAATTNLMIFVGWTALAVALKRAAVVPAAVAIGLPIMQVLIFPGSAVGGPVIAGMCFAAVGWMLYHGELPRRSARRTLEPATR